MSSGGSDSESISECELRQLQNQIKNLFVAATIMNPSIHRKKLIKWKKRMESVSEKEGSKEDETRLGNNMV